MIDGIKTYKILGKHGITTFISNKHTASKPCQWLDEDAGESLSLRYATNQMSIFEKDQKEPIILAEIMAEDGILRVSKRTPKLIKFLEHHPDNIINGGMLFQEIDKEAEARERDAIMDIELDARIYAREMSEEDARKIARVEIPSRVDKMYKEEIHSWIKVFAMNNPELFLSMIESPVVARKSVVAEALAQNVITYKNNKSEVAWSHGTKNTTICRLPSGQDPEESLTRFLLSDKGKSVFQDIEEVLLSL